MLRGFTHIRSNYIAARVAITVIVLFFLVKGTYLAITVPLFDTADEMFHFDYVYQVYQGEGPPHIFDDSIHEDVFFGAYRSPVVHPFCSASCVGFQSVL